MQPEPTIRHHGAVNGVTGSCHQLMLAPDASLLVDCGLFQGSDAAPAAAPTNWPSTSTSAPCAPCW